MSTTPDLDEHHLSIALSEIADEAGAPDEFRRRLMSDLQGRQRSPVVRHLRPILAVAACVLVIVAATFALALHGGHRPATHPAHPTPDNPYVVATFTGAGNAVRNVPADTAPAGRQTTIRISCHGPAGVQLRVNTYRVNSCDRPGVTALGDGHRKTPAQLRIVTAPSVSWRITVVFDIYYRSDGIVEHPADPLLNVRNPLARQQGTGTGIVHLTGTGIESRPPGGVRVIIACTGQGLTLSSPDKRFDGQYTRTCEPDTTFAFDIAHVAIPSTFTVNAAHATSWRLVVIGA
jgi:hypothetical protein